MDAKITNTYKQINKNKSIKTNPQKQIDCNKSDKTNSQKQIKKFKNKFIRTNQL